VKISANGISINCEIEGQGDNIILIHGAFDNLDMWYNQIPVFSKKYRVITYDIRGSGKTESPEMDYTVPLFAEDLYEFTKAIDVESAVFVGFSLGGRIAAQLALDHPASVTALVLSSSAAGLATAPTSRQALTRFQRTLDLLGKGDINTAAEIMTAAGFSPNFKSKNPAEFERFKQTKMQNHPQGLIRVMQSLQAENSPDLSQLQCPTLIIVGENDPLMTVALGQQLKARIPDSRLVVLPTGHASAIELPDRFNKVVLDFISEVIG